MNETADQRSRQGFLAGLAAYLLWGLVPLYWPLLLPAGALEILAMRIVWSLAIAVVLLLVVGRRGFRARVGDRRTVGLLALAAVIVGLNWGVYIWAVNHGQVVAASLGYYINPIISVLLGVFVLGERLVRVQWVAVGIAAAAVVLLTIDHGRPPWISLVLAVSFAVYGLLKKRVNRGAVDTLTVESAVLTPAALVYLVVLQQQGGLSFGAYGFGHAALLASAGLVTIVPLLLFSTAAVRIPLSTLGLLQYLTPTAQFLIGVGYFHESMSPLRWVGFGLVWVALVIMSGYGLSRSAARRRALPEAPATG